MHFFELSYGCPVFRFVCFAASFTTAVPSVSHSTRQNGYVYDISHGGISILIWPELKQRLVGISGAVDKWFEWDIKPTSRVFVLYIGYIKEPGGFWKNE